MAAWEDRTITIWSRRSCSKCSGESLVIPRLRNGGRPLHRLYPLEVRLDNGTANPVPQVANNNNNNNNNNNKFLGAYKKLNALTLLQKNKLVKSYKIFLITGIYKINERVD